MTIEEIQTRCARIDSIIGTSKAGYSCWVQVDATKATIGIWVGYPSSSKHFREGPLEQCLDEAEAFARDIAAGRNAPEAEYASWFGERNAA